MTEEELKKQVQSIFIDNFEIKSENFTWTKSLENLNENFKILSYLVFLEQIIELKFNKKIPVIESISTAYHTPKDILELISNYTNPKLKSVL